VVVVMHVILEIYWNNEWLVTTQYDWKSVVDHLVKDHGVPKEILYFTRRDDMFALMVVLCRLVM